MRPTSLAACIGLFSASIVGAQAKSYSEMMAARPALVHDAAADSVYASGRRALNRNDFRSAIAAFAVVGDRHPLALVAPNSWYWRAYAHYRLSGDSADTSGLRSALDAIAVHMTRYEDAFTRTDIAELLHRVRAELAGRGDPESARAMTGARIGATQIIDCRATMPGEHARALESLAKLTPDQAARTFGEMMFGQGMCHDVSGAAALYARLTTREMKTVVIAALGRSLHTSATKQLLEIARNGGDQHASDIAVAWLQIRGDPAVNEAIRVLRETRGSR